MSAGTIMIILLILEPPGVLPTWSRSRGFGLALSARLFVKTQINPSQTVTG